MSPAARACVYMVVKSCGCRVGALVDDPDLPDPTKLLVDNWLERGLTLERVTVGEARQRLSRCTCAEEKAETDRYAYQSRERRARDIKAAEMRAERPQQTYVAIATAIGVSTSYARQCAMRGRRWIASRPSGGG